MNKLFITLVCLVILFVGSVEVYAESHTVSVVTYGAYPNDGVPDSAAIQNAINSVAPGWKIYFPAGRYMIDQVLEINRSDITLYGDGIASELYTPQNTNHMLLQIPSRANGQACVDGQAIVPKNILIEKLSFSGDLNRGTEACPADAACSLLSGIYLFNGENITFKDVLVKEFNLEGISVSNGTKTPKNITLERVRTMRVRRNGLHLGYGENIVIKDCFLEDSQDAVWGPTAGNAIDLEVEGLDQVCAPFRQWDPYLYNVSITNTLVKSPNSQWSRGGFAIQPAYGPIRKAKVLNNVLVNSAGIVSVGADYPSGRDVDPKIGRSLRNRDLEISSNWVSNLHQPGEPDMATAALTLTASGDLADAYGPNDIMLSDNVLTVYINGGNNRLFQFSGVKYLSGNNNKTYRPFQINPPGYDPGGTSHNFLWRKEMQNVTDPNNSHFQLLNTLDNGWPGSRLISYDPNANPQYVYLPEDGGLTGTDTLLSWVNNASATPTASPSLISFAASSTAVQVEVEEPNNLPVRVMVLHNGFPLGLKDVVGNSLTIQLPRTAQFGDEFVIMAFNQHGQFSERTCTYFPNSMCYWGMEN